MCGDVRPVLREVFRELAGLPPLAPRHTLQHSPHKDTRLPTLNPFIDKCDSERKDIWRREGDLKQQYAKRISREPLPNIYRLQPPCDDQSSLSSWKREQGIVHRRDLIPSVTQNSNVEGTLWVNNILNRSSGDLSPMMVLGRKVDASVRLGSPSETSLQSVSIGEVRARLPPPPVARPPPPPAPEHVLCVPPHLDFVNFTVGHLHTQALRLVNVSECEVRLSVRPPASRALHVELCGPRGLAVSSGAAADIKLHFRPRDVRVLRDVLLVRVSTGKLIHVPISCYMQPPFLDILVPAVSSSVLSCTGTEACVTRSTDCLELGARLLGDVHCVPVLFHCEAEHAAFFLLTEDAWLSFSLDVVSARGALVAAPFAVCPAAWRGGGAVRARVWCRARAAGLHAAALRVLASSAVVRPLHLIADALYFRPEHVTLQAQEKDYDICSEDDPACEYFVHLGTAFPGRALAATIHLVNHSPVEYQYYWSVRPWGACSCWAGEREQGELLQGGWSEACSAEEDDSLCVGAKEARDKELREGPADTNPPSSAARLRVEPARGCIAPRSSCGVHVCVPDAGHGLAMQRAVLMLILKGIPVESLPNDYDPMIVKTEVVESDKIPGVKRWSREVCEIVCAQLEVWWEVAPVRFVLDPPILHLEYSRRITDVEVVVRATQLFGCDGVACAWRAPAHVRAPAPPALAPAHSCAAALRYSLPDLPNHFPETDVITLEAAHAEWRASSVVSRRCATRHPALRPARRWLGLVPPGAALRTVLDLHNDTYQHHTCLARITSLSGVCYIFPGTFRLQICWWASPFRWHGERAPGAACAGARGACARCQERACSCSILSPARGALHHAHTANIVYSVHAPEHDGCVATLVAVHRTSADVARAAHGAGSDARAALVAYRVLAPRLVLRALPGRGDYADCAPDAGCTPDADCAPDADCMPDAGAGRSARGTTTLRPCAALPLGLRSRYRLRLTNTTPLPTAVSWDPPLEEEHLKVSFYPEEFDVGSYAQVDIQVVVEAVRVCGRRLFVRRARVRHAYQPLYLVIDAAVSGLEIVCEVPLGGAESTETTALVRRTQAEVYPWQRGAPPRTFHDIFVEEDRKRAARAENLCRCKCEMEYVPPPPPRPRPPPQHDDDYPPVEIVWEPPPLTRVCACRAHAAPALPARGEDACLQFRAVPLRTVRTRRIVVRNESPLAAAWSAAVRTWPREQHRTLHADQWAGGVRAGGVCVHVAPGAGVLAPRARLDLRVAVYGDCWGLYRDQLAIQFENLEAIVLDLWVEVVGPPLQFALSLGAEHTPVLCWTSGGEAARALRVKNASRAALQLQLYLCEEHECARHELPFRLYYRLVDVPPPSCPCLCEPEQSTTSSWEEEVDTGVELFLARDVGLQTDAYYTVSPESRSMSPEEWATWRVERRGEAAPPCALLLRARPARPAGEQWARPAPPPQLVRLLPAPRAGRLRTSRRDLRVRVCALDLPLGDVLRVRKRFNVQNVGNGRLAVGARTEPPWSVVLQGAGCPCGARGDAARGDAARVRDTTLVLLPMSSLEMCVEVRVSTVEASPAPSVPPAPTAPPAPAAYPPRRETTTQLHFYDEDNILKTMSLILELEYPVLSMEPAAIDFGFVTDGDTRKSYYSVAHSSRTAVVELCTEWVGGGGFRLHPRRLALRPGARERVYIQYTAKWCGAPAEGWCVVRAAGGAGVWCRCAGAARGSPSRDLARRAGPRDHTDDARLQPPAISSPLCL